MALRTGNQSMHMASSAYIEDTMSQDQLDRGLVLQVNRLGNLNFRNAIHFNESIMLSNLDRTF